MRRMTATGLLATLLLVAGCVTPWGMNMQTRQERQLEESRGVHAVTEEKTEAERILPGFPPMKGTRYDTTGTVFDRFGGLPCL